MNEGYIKLYRSLLKWRWWHDDDTTRVFLYILLMANWEEHDFENLHIRRGQLISSRKKIAEDVGITERSVRTALNHLKSTNEVTIETTKRGTLITVVNYEHYQMVPQKVTNKTTKETTNDRPTTDQQPTRYKKKKKNKEIYKSVIEMLTDDENRTLESLFSPTQILEIVDQVDERYTGRDFSEIQNPLRYCIAVGRDLGFTGGQHA